MKFQCVTLLVLTGSIFVVNGLRYDGRKCGDISVDKCFKEMQTFLKLTALPFTSDSNELNKLCQQSLEGFNCSRALFLHPDCLSDKDKELLPLFISMAQYDYSMLCASDDAYMRDMYLLHSDCILKNMKQLECCATGSSIPEFPLMHIVDSSKSVPERALATCCPLSNYMQCSMEAIIDVCGEEAGNFTMEYILRSAGEPVHHACQMMPNYPTLDSNTCTDSIPQCSGCERNGLKNCLLFLILLILMQIFI